MKRLLYLLTASSCSIVVVALLWFAAHKRFVPAKGFYRLFPPHVITKFSRISLGSGYFQLTGLDSPYAYLNKNNDRSKIITVNLNSELKTERDIIFPAALRFAWGAKNLDVFNGQMLYSEGITPAVLAIDLVTGDVKSLVAGSEKFDLFCPVSNQSFVIRTYDTLLQQNILAFENSRSDHKLFARHLLQKQVDGIFCTDGQLLYDSELSMAVYMYYYRNEVICADSNLNLIRRFHTIDTISTAQINIGQFSNGLAVTSTLSSPPLQVNKRASANGKNLFVQSLVISNDEDEKIFHSNTVIDVYSLVKGAYKFSFNIPEFRNEKLVNFEITGNRLVVLYRHDLLIYELEPKYVNSI